MSEVFEGGPSQSVATKNSTGFLGCVKPPTCCHLDVSLRDFDGRFLLIHCNI